MKFLKPFFLPAAIITSAILIQGCAAKKEVATHPAPVVAAYPDAPPVNNTPPPPPPPVPAPAPVAAPPAPAPAPAPDYNFSNIQFEFNSGILKTDSYPAMDKASAALRADPTLKFNINGYASAEGTDAHNMALSLERANAVKTYLVNSGVNADNLTAKGFGESNPVADNSTDAGKILNRRVEIKKRN